MPVTIRNMLTTTLDVPGAGLIFYPGEMKTVDTISPALSAAIQSGKLEVIEQSAASVIVVAEDGETEFDLPIPWPGPDAMPVALNGLVLVFGDDYTVDAATNQLVWLDEEITLSAGDRLHLVGGAP